MNHPTREEWMSYLYGEPGTIRRTGLDDHLRHCPACAAALNEWQAAQTSLDTWKLPARSARRAPVRPALAWAAAAAILLIVSFVAGRLSSAGMDVAKMRAAIEPEVRRQLQQEFAQMLHTELDKAVVATLAASGERARDLVAEYAGVAEARRADDNRALAAALARLDEQHTADVIALKKDLDTVAVNTDAGLRLTEQQLIQLADYTRPASRPISIP